MFLENTCRPKLVVSLNASVVIGEMFVLDDVVNLHSTELSDPMSFRCKFAGQKNLFPTLCSIQSY